MKTFIVTVASIVALFSLSMAAQAASDSSISSLQKRVSTAQKQVDQARANFDQAKDKAESGMSSSDKTEWRQAEAKYEKMAAGGKDPEKIPAQKEALGEIESRVMKPSDREKVDDSRDVLARANAKLDQAKANLRLAQQKNNNDESSQAIQPENRTQNGSNFSIRSERDAETHPPLPNPQ